MFEVSGNLHCSVLPIEASIMNPASLRSFFFNSCSFLTGEENFHSRLHFSQLSNFFLTATMDLRVLWIWGSEDWLCEMDILDNRSWWCVKMWNIFTIDGKSWEWEEGDNSVKVFEFSFSDWIRRLLLDNAKWEERANTTNWAACLWRKHFSFDFYSKWCKRDLNDEDAHIHLSFAHQHHLHPPQAPQ